MELLIVSESVHESLETFPLPTHLPVEFSALWLETLQVFYFSLFYCTVRLLYVESMLSIIYFITLTENLCQYLLLFLFSIRTLTTPAS